MSPRDYRRNRTAADVARAIGAEYSLPPTDDRRLEQLVEHHLGDQQPGAPAARVRADGDLGHTRGWRPSRAVADVRLEVQALAATDRDSDRRKAESDRRRELGRTRSNADLAWLCDRAAGDDLKNADAWGLLAELFRQTATAGEAASRLLGVRRESVRTRAIEALTFLLADDRF